MKRLLFLLIIFTATWVNAQSNLTIFNNGGQQFYVILNGIKQNSLPMTNVVVSGISNGSYSVKLIFADGKTPDIDKNFFIEEPSDITTRVVFKKGKGKLQLIGMQPSKNSPAQENTILYRPNEGSVYSDAPAQSSNSVQQTVTTTTTTQQNGGTVDPATGMNMSVQMNDPVNGGQFNMNVNVNGAGQTTQTSQSTTVTQTTTTTTSSMNGTSHEVNCKNLLGDTEKYVAELKAFKFESDRKMELKKDMIEHCLTANQAYKLIELFQYDSDKLEIAKYLYDRIIDKDNSGLIYPLFQYESSKAEFREYIGSGKN